MVARTERLVYQPHPPIPALPEQEQETKEWNWQSYALEALEQVPLNFPEEEIKRLKKTRGREPLEVKKERYLSRAWQVAWIAANFDPEFLRDQSSNPDSGLCFRAVEAIKALQPRIRLTKENFPLFRALGYQEAKFVKETTLSGENLSFLPPIMVNFLRAHLLWETSHKTDEQTDEQKLLRKQTKITEGLAHYLLLWRFSLYTESGSNKAVVNFLKQKLVTNKRVMSAILGKRNTLPRRVENFCNQKVSPPPGFGWDQSLDLVQALAFSCASKSPQKRLGILFERTLGGKHFAHKSQFLKSVAPEEWSVFTTYSSVREKIFISFGSLKWLVFMLSQPGRFSTAVDFTPAQRLCFIKTIMLLLGYRNREDALYCSFRGPTIKRFNLFQELVEAAITLDFPLNVSFTKDGGYVGMPWLQFQHFTETGVSSRDWYQTDKAERYFLAWACYFHSAAYSLGILRERGRIFSHKELVAMKNWRARVTIPLFLEPIFQALCGPIPKAEKKEERKEAIRFMSQIFFRQGLEVILKLKGFSPQTSLAELARVFVEIDGRFCDLTKLPLETLFDWRESLQPAINDRRWKELLHEWRWIGEINLAGVEEVKEKKITLGNLLKHLENIGISNGVLAQLKNILPKRNELQNYTGKIIESWLRAFINNKGGKKRISGAELTLFGIALVRRAVQFEQAVKEYWLLMALGMMALGKGTITYNQNGFSRKQLAEKFFNEAMGKASEANALAVVAQMTASQSGLNDDAFTDIDKELEKITQTRTRNQTPVENYPLSLKFMAGMVVSHSEGAFVSFHRNKQGHPCLGDGLKAYRTHGWAEEDYKVYRLEEKTGKKI